MFNSLPVDMMESNGTKSDKQKKNSISSDAKLHEGQIRGRIEMLLKYLRKYGVPEKHLFEVHELQDMSNIPKVTRCIAMLGKMVSNSQINSVRFIENFRTKKFYLCMQSESWEVSQFLSRLKSVTFPNFPCQDKKSQNVLSLILFRQSRLKTLFLVAKKIRTGE